ncbi:MAG: hypothetical protein Aureis2KO_21110 [Aureisphaera sp.]
MRVGITHKNYKAIITVLGIIFLIVSIYIHTTGDFYTYRMSRGIIIFAFLALLIYYKTKGVSRVMVAFLMVYGLSSILTIWYENNTSATWAMLLSFVSYIILIVSLIPKVNLKKMNAALLILFIILIGINGFLLFELVAIIKAFTLSGLHYIFILLGAMSLTLLGFLALLFNHNYSNKATLMFTFFVFLLIFSEVFRSLGYYDIAYGDIAVYIARALLIAALSMLLNYAISDKKTSGQLGMK